MAIKRAGVTAYSECESSVAIKKQCVNHFLTPLTTVAYSAKKRFTPSLGLGTAD